MATNGLQRRQFQNFNRFFSRSSPRSTRRDSQQLGIPQPTIWRVIRRRLVMRPYKMHMVLDEFNYCLDVVLAAREGHIEHL